MWSWQVMCIYYGCYETEMFFSMQNHISEDAQSTVNAVEAFHMPACASLTRNTALDLTIEYRCFLLSCGKMKLWAGGVEVRVAQLGNVKAFIHVRGRDDQRMTLC